jgi:hypothetical protein
MSGTEAEVKRARVDLRLPHDLYERIVERAKVSDRSVTAELTRAIRHYLERAESGEEYA